MHSLSTLIETEEFSAIIDRLTPEIRTQVDQALFEIAAQGTSQEDAMEISGNGWLLWSVPAPGTILLLWVE